MKFISYKNKTETLAKILVESYVFQSFSKVRNLSADEKTKLAKNYIRKEEQALLGEDGIFDVEFYKSRFPLRTKAPKNYMIHYITTGYELRLSPHLMFDVGYYMHEAEKKVKNVSGEPYEHYCKIGWKENICPSMYFDNDWYSKTYIGDPNSEISPLEHFLMIGSERGYSVSPFFSKIRVDSHIGHKTPNTLAALRHYIDLSDAGHDVDPHPLFDVRFYKKQYVDVTKHGFSPLAHFTAYGLGEKRMTMPLTSFPVGTASDLDRLQFRFINFADYFGTKRLFNRYNYLDELLIRIQTESYADRPRPLAIIAAYNDEDCIDYIIRAAIREGMSLWLIDNWSSDKTFEIMSRLSEDPMISAHIETIERYPVSGPSEYYDWHGILERKQTIASKFPNRWVLHQDSDEITTSIIPNATCAETLHAIADAGYNAVNMRMFDFRPIDRSEPQGNLEEHFRYFEFSDKPGYGAQMKAWVQPDTAVNLTDSGGHYAKFDTINAYPLRLPRKHYALRSVAHARRKITVERMPRFEKERKEKGWHTHYDAGFDENKFIWDKERLQLYTSIGHASIWFEKLLNDDFVFWS